MSDIKKCPCGGDLKHVRWGNMDFDTAYICLVCKTMYTYADIETLKALNDAYDEEAEYSKMTFNEFCKAAIEIINRNKSEDKRWKFQGQKIVSKKEKEEEIFNKTGRRVTID